jgi:hypothetical protein
MKISVGIFTLIFCRYVFYRWNHRRQFSVGKTLVSNLLFVHESISNKFIDGVTDGQMVPKQITGRDIHR